MPSTKMKSSGSLVNKLCFSCSTSDAPCFYKSADSICLSLMEVSCRWMGGTGGKTHMEISRNIESPF